MLGRSPTTADPAPGLPPPAPAAQEAILDETVTVQNEVSEVVGPSLITIGADDTPVTVATVDTSTLTEGDQVQVTGTVQQISMPEEYTTEVSPRWGVAYEQNEYDYLGGRQYDLGVRADSVEVLEQD